MKSRGRLFGVFFGWWTVLAFNLMTVWGQSLYIYGYGVFLKPLAEEFGWGRAITAGAGSLGKIEGGIEGPLRGMAIRKYGPRIMCFVGNLIAGFGIILMSRVDSLLCFYITWAVVSFGFNIGLGGAASVAVSQWFVKKRGLARSITGMGFGIGGFIMPVTLTFLLLLYNWREMFIIVGLVSLVILLPLSWFFVKTHGPEYYGVLPDGAKVEGETDTASLLKAGEAYAKEVGEVEFTAKQAYRTKALWLTVAALSIHLMLIGVTDIHTIPFLTDLGMDPLVAAAGAGLSIGVSLPFRLLAGILCDKVGITKIRFLFLAGLVGDLFSFIILLNAGTNVSLLYTYLILYGISNKGFCATMLLLILPRYFGRKEYSIIEGTTSLVWAIGGIVAPIYAGWIYDVTGSYRGIFTALLLLTAAGIVITYLAKPPKPPNTVQLD